MFLINSFRLFEFLKTGRTCIQSGANRCGDIHTLLSNKYEFQCSLGERCRWTVRMVLRGKDVKGKWDDRKVHGKVLGEGNSFTHSLFTPTCFWPVAHSHTKTDNYITIIC